MNADFLIYAAFAAAGWALRHFNLLGPKSASPPSPGPASPSPMSPSSPGPAGPPADLPPWAATLMDMLRLLLDQTQPPGPGSTSPAGAGVVHVPVQVSVTPAAVGPKLAA